MCSFRADTPAHAQSTDLRILVDEGTTVASDEGPPAEKVRVGDALVQCFHAVGVHETAK